jgi:hypothetical protein
MSARDKITPHIWLGDSGFAYHIYKLHTKKITSVLGLVEEIHNEDRDGIFRVGINLAMMMSESL